MKSKRIRGFPVINLEDGSTEGRVQDLVIDPEQKTVEGLLIGEKGFLKGRHRFIDFSSIHSIGEDAVTIKEVDSDSPEISSNLELLKDYSIIGKSIISNEGNYIAKVLDFTFSTRTGKIESFLLQDIKGREPIDMDVFLTIDGVLNLGKDYVIADSNYIDYFTEESREQEEMPGEEESELPDDSVDMKPGDVIEIQYAQKQREAEGNSEPGRDSREQDTQEQDPPAFDGFDNLKESWNRVEEEISRGSKQVARESRERMTQYVRNKKANYSVWDRHGNVLAQKGQVISDEIIEKAEAQEKIPQLFFSVVSEEIEESLNIIGDKISRIFR